MSELELRPLVFEELEPVIALHRETWFPHADPEGFRAWYVQMLATPWARRHVQIMGGFVGGRLVSAFRMHRLEMLVNGTKRQCAGVGTVLTLPAWRGQGHASAMIRAAIERFRGNHDFCLVFSNVGPRFYKRLGFFPVPSYKYVAVNEIQGVLPYATSGNGNGHGVRQGETVQAEARPFRPEDLPRLVEIYNLDVSLRKLGILRSESYWEHLFTKERLQASLLGEAGTELRTYVCSADERVTSYMTFRLLKDRLHILESPAESPRFQSWMLHFAVLLSRSEHKPKVEAQMPFRQNEAAVRILTRRDTPLAMIHPLHGGLRAQEFPYPAENTLWARDRF